MIAPETCAPRSNSDTRNAGVWSAQAVWPHARHPVGEGFEHAVTPIAQYASCIRINHNKIGMIAATTTSTTLLVHFERVSVVDAVAAVIAFCAICLTNGRISTTIGVTNATTRPMLSNHCGLTGPAWL